MDLDNVLRFSTSPNPKSFCYRSSAAPRQPLTASCLFSCHRVLAVRPTFSLRCHYRGKPHGHMHASSISICIWFLVGASLRCGKSSSETQSRPPPKIGRKERKKERK